MYAKVKTDKQLEIAPNPMRVVIANPTGEEYKHFGWLPVIETEKPEYDPETQYVTPYYEQEGEEIIQKWEIHDIPEPEPTLEDRVDNLENGMDAIVGGENE